MQAEVAAGPTASTTPSAPRPFITSPGPGARNWSTSDAIDQAASLLEFQGRVLAEAEFPQTPILERVKFLAIVGRNLDEFAMVRSKHWTSGTAEHVRQNIVGLRRRAASLLQNDLLPGLASQGVVLTDVSALTASERHAVDAIFEQQILPSTTVLWLEHARMTTTLPGLGLNAAVEVRDPDGRERVAIVRLPDRPTAIVPFAPDAARGPHVQRSDAIGLVWAADLVLEHLDRVLPGHEIGASHLFRLVREGDLVVSGNETKPLPERVLEAARRRDLQPVVLLTLATSMPATLAKQLTGVFDVEERAVMRERDVHDLARLWDLTRLPRPDLRHRRFLPRHSAALESASPFDAIREQDHLLHHPYDSFEPVVNLVRAAAEDPFVERIATTLYRTDRDQSPLVDALVAAARRGVEVQVVVELRARFDERRNAEWTRCLEDAGAQVCHGRDGLKIHAKMTLIRRHDAEGVRSYVHVSSGNYSAFTSHVYTDVALLTTNPAIASDVEHLFGFLARRELQIQTSLVLAAPTGLRQRLLVLIDREIAHARRGAPAHLVLKMNALTDPQAIAALCRASEAGVQIDLIVRGVCILRPGVPGLSSRVRIRSVVGRFLEHSRVWWFANGGEEELFIGSADLMPRNFDRRVEVMVPVTTPALARRVRDEVLRLQLADPAAYELHPDGSYRRPAGQPPSAGCQAQLVERYAPAHAVSGSGPATDTEERTDTA